MAKGPIRALRYAALLNAIADEAERGVLCTANKEQGASFQRQSLDANRVIS